MRLKEIRPIKLSELRSSFQPYVDSSLRRFSFSKLFVELNERNCPTVS